MRKDTSNAVPADYTSRHNPGLHEIVRRTLNSIHVQSATYHESTEKQQPRVHIVLTRVARCWPLGLCSNYYLILNRGVVNRGFYDPLSTVSTDQARRAVGLNTQR